MELSQINWNTNSIPYENFKPQKNTILKYHTSSIQVSYTSRSPIYTTIRYEESVLCYIWKQPYYQKTPFLLHIIQIHVDYNSDKLKKKLKLTKHCVGLKMKISSSAKENVFLFLIGVFPHRVNSCLLYTSPSPRDKRQSRMPSSA